MKWLLLLFGHVYQLSINLYCVISDPKPAHDTTGPWRGIFGLLLLSAVVWLPIVEIETDSPKLSFDTTVAPSPSALRLCSRWICHLKQQLLLLLSLWPPHWLVLGSIHLADLPHSLPFDDVSCPSESHRLSIALFDDLMWLEEWCDLMFPSRKKEVGSMAARTSRQLLRLRANLSTILTWWNGKKFVYDRGETQDSYFSLDTYR